MPIQRRTARRPLVAGKPRYLWRQFHNAEFVLTPGSQAFTSFSNTGGWPDLVDLGVHGDYTIRRVRGKIFATSALGSETNVMESLGYGAGIFQSDAVAVTAFPEIFADPFDWFIYGIIGVSLASAGLTAGVHPLMTEVIDNKSMRKVNENHQEAGLIMESSAANAGNITITVSGRMLISYGRT